MVGRLVLAMMALTLLTACHSAPTPEKSLAREVSDAHGLWEWQNGGALAGDIHVEWQGLPNFDAQFVFETRTNRARMQLADDRILVFDGQTAWVCPASTDTAFAKLHLLTWPQLISMPFALGQVEQPPFRGQLRQLSSQSCETVQLPVPGPKYPTTLYFDPQTHLLRGMVYPEQWAAPQLASEPSASRTSPPPMIAVTFYRYEQFNGVTLPTQWRFWRWNETLGIHGHPIAWARLYNFEMTWPKKTAFVKPPDARSAE